jgi:glycosyltransferase involved in cell wall biosynthesis
LNYIIITPAYNEEKYIGETIESVIAQSVKPIRWVIVDDGSTDQTADIIKSYTSRFPWIQYVLRVRNADQSYYASNVYAIQKGMSLLDELSFDYIAILDADISLPSDYYENLSEIFVSDARLGVAAGNLVDKIANKLVKHLYDRRSCTKAVVVFRRECFEQIGGFVPLKYGGEDTCACFSARMLGWKVWSFRELMIIHNKPLGTGPSKKVLSIRFRQGLCDWALAAPLSFAILKSIRRCIKEPPFIMGGLARIIGYLYGCCSGEERQISSELAQYIRNEQRSRVLHRNRIPIEHQVNFTFTKKTESF